MSPSCTQDLKELNAELLTYTKTLEAALAQKDFELAESQKDLGSYQAKLQEALDIADDLAKSKEAATTLYNGNINKMAECNEKNANLQGQLLLIQSAHDSATEKLQKAESEVQVLTNECDGLNKYVEELNSSLEAAQQRVLEESKKYENLLLTSREDGNLRSALEEENVDLMVKFDILEAENQQLKRSLKRSKDLGTEAQELVDTSETRIAVLEGQLEDASKEKLLLQREVSKFEQEIGAFKESAEKMETERAKEREDRKVLAAECRKLKEANVSVAKLDRAGKAEAALASLEKEHKKILDELQTARSREADLRFSSESYQSKLKALQSRIDATEERHRVERESLMKENEARSKAASSLRIESQNNNELYLSTLEKVQEKLSEVQQDAQESRAFSRSLGARLLKLKAQVTRECEYNLDTDDNLKQELLRVFDLVSRKAKKVQDLLQVTEDGDKKALEESKSACALLEERLLQQTEEERQGKQRYEQLLAENNFSIIALKKEKKTLEELVDGRDEKLRQYLLQIDDGRATIQQLHEDMVEARAAYEDLSRSTVDLMGKTERDGMRAEKERNHDYQEKANLRAILKERDQEIASLRADQKEKVKTTGLTHEEVQKLATSFENSQRQVRSLTAQKAELLERMIAMSRQPQPEEGIQPSHFYTPSTTSANTRSSIPMSLDLPPPPPGSDSPSSSQSEDNDDGGDGEGDTWDLHVSTDDEDNDDGDNGDSGDDNDDDEALAGTRLWAGPSKEF